jgi:predicted nucleotidyltransferase
MMRIEIELSAGPVVQEGEFYEMNVADIAAGLAKATVANLPGGIVVHRILIEESDA